MNTFSQDQMRAIKKAIDQALSSGANPIAAFDADGTLWDMDMGENFFDFQVKNQLIPDLPREAWAHYRKLHDKDQATAFLWLAQINKNRELSEIRNWAKQAFADHGPIPVFPHMKEIIDHLHNCKVQTYVVTASIRWAVEPGAELLGIPAENVIGVQTKVKNGIISDVQEGPVTWREGKVKGLLLNTQDKSPFFAAGNTMGDLALLESATHLRFANCTVAPHHHNFPTEASLAKIALERGWHSHRHPAHK